jgi:DeoR/GlpR family transcriptional regulator of sugar metabolism
MTHCDSVVVLADSEKFSTTAPNKIADLSQIDFLVTNTAPGPEFTTALTAADVTVITPEEPTNGLS